jgi:TRAP-type C4-dicarboxylate transport system permease large subunit
MGITESVSAFLLNMPFGDYGIIAAIAIIYLVGGMFIEDWTLLLLTIPFILPVIRELGFTNVWFGAWFTIWGIAGVITPPFGLCLFVLHSVVPKHDIITIALGAWPFVIPMIIMGILLVIFPQLALWLPNLLY